MPLSTLAFVGLSHGILEKLALMCGYHQVVLFMNIPDRLAGKTAACPLHGDPSSCGAGDRAMGQGELALFREKVLPAISLVGHRSRDFYHTCYCLSGLSVAQHFGSGELLHEVVLGVPENRLVSGPWVWAGSQWDRACLHPLLVQRVAP